MQVQQDEPTGALEDCTMNNVFDRPNPKIWRIWVLEPNSGIMGTWTVFSVASVQFYPNIIQYCRTYQILHQSIWEVR